MVWIRTWSWWLGVPFLVGAACPQQNATPPTAPQPLGAAARQVVAHAGADVEVVEGETVFLNAHASRTLDGAPFSLAWSQIEGPAVLLANPTSMTPTFVAPLAKADLVFRARISSGEASDQDDVRVRVVESTPTPPRFINIPGDIAPSPGTPVDFQVEWVPQTAEPFAIELSGTCLPESVQMPSSSTISVVAPDVLPCTLNVRGEFSDGLRTAKATRVFWPPTTPMSASTRIQAPLLVTPGEEALLRFEERLPEQSVRLWPAGSGALGLSTLATSRLVTLQAPQRRTRIFLGAEERRGPASGGVQYFIVDVSAGPGNQPPTASGGPDRTVRPTARLRIDTTASMDLDDDDVSIHVAQVLGHAATLVPEEPNVFLAPDQAGVLLFHVQAFDQTVFSDVDTVRVYVDPESASVGPELVVSPTRYVTPGDTFVLDASGATDPDSGFIAHWSIRQRAEDDVILLDQPVNVPTIGLRAADDGDRYHFILSATDEDGLTASTEVEVIVETAGPIVDRNRAPSTGRNGTPEAPFQSVAEALPVLVRHQFTELHVASGDQGLLQMTPPAGVKLRGGYSWQTETQTYVLGTERSALAIEAGPILLDDTQWIGFVLSMSETNHRLLLRGQTLLEDVRLLETAPRDIALLEVESGAHVSLRNVEVTGFADAVFDDPLDEVPLLDLHHDSTLRIRDSIVRGGAGTSRTAIRCNGGVLDVYRSELLGSTRAELGRGLHAEECEVQIISSQIAGGDDSVSTTGVQVANSQLFVSADSTVIGTSDGVSADACALRIDHVAQFAYLSGIYHAVGGNAVTQRAVGLDMTGSRIEVAQAEIVVSGALYALGLHVSEAQVRVFDVNVRVVATEEAEGLRVNAPHELVSDNLRVGCEGKMAKGLVSAGPASDAIATLSRAVWDVYASAGPAEGLGLDSFGDVSLQGVEVRASSPTLGIAKGIQLAAGRLVDCVVRVDGVEGATAVNTLSSSAGVQLDRSELRASSSAGAAFSVQAGGPFFARSSYARAMGVPGVAVSATQNVSLVHATLYASDEALWLAHQDGDALVVNTALIAPVGIVQESPRGAGLVAANNAFAGEVAYLIVPDMIASSIEAWAAEPGSCENCISVDANVVDDDGRLISQENPLVDSGSSAFSVPFDIDNEMRPQGADVDIGCDEQQEMAPFP